VAGRGLFRRQPQPQQPPTRLVPSGAAPISVTVADSLSSITEAAIRTNGGYYNIVKNDLPLAYWRLGDVSGNALDSSGNGHTMTANGSITHGVTGALSGDTNTAMTFNGVDQWLQVAYGSWADVGDSFTLECWYKRGASSNDFETLMVITTGPNLEVRFGVVYLRQGDGGTPGTFLRHSSLDLTGDTNYHHIVGTKRGSDVHVYIDGVDVTVFDGDFTMPNGTYSVDIGSGADNYNYALKGTVDEAAIYSYALTPTQVARHYASRVNNPWWPRAVADSIATLTEAVVRTAGGYYKVVRTDGPVAYWRLGELTGSTADDDIGSNDGTYVASPTLGTTGALSGDTNTAVTFNGSTQWVTINDNNALDVGDRFSIEGWAYRPAASLGQVGVVATKGFGSFSIEWADDEKIYFQKSGDSEIAQSLGTLSVDTWHHIVCTKNGSDYHVYVDGVDVTNPIGNLTFTNNAEEFIIGRRRLAASPGFPFPGRLDEIALYDYALNARQVARHYAARTLNPWWPRTVADSISTLTEAVVRVLIFGRTVTDSLATLTESVVRGPLTIARTVADSISSITATVARVLTASRTVTDSISTLTEAIVRGPLTIARAAADSISSITATVARVFTGTRTAADSLSAITEAVVRVVTYGRTVADSIATLTATVARVLTGSRTAADSVATLTDAVTRALALVRTVADRIEGAFYYAGFYISGFYDGTISDAITRVVTFGRTTADTLAGDPGFQVDSFQTGTFQEGDGITESVSRVGTFLRTGADSLSTLTESVIRVFAGSRTVSATISAITEAVSAVKTFPRTVADSLSSITESPTRVGTFIRSVPQTLGSIAEAVTRTLSGARSVADSLPTLTEAVTRIGTFTRTVAQSLGSITEAVTKVVTFARTTSDSLPTLTEAVNRVGTFARTVADSIGSISETVAAATNALVRSVSDSISSITETVSRAGTFTRTVADSLASITEAVVASITTIIRTVSDSISSITDSASRTLSASRTISDTVAAITEAVTQVTAFGRAVADSLSSVTDSVSRAWTGARTATDTVGSITEAVSRALASVRSAADSIVSITEAVVAETFSSIVRTVADSVASISESVSRVLVINRLISDSLGAVSEAVTRVGTFVRSAADSIPSISEMVAAAIKTIHEIAATITIATTAAALSIRQTAASISIDTIAAAITVVARRLIAAVTISSISAHITVNGEAVTDILVEGDTAPLIQAVLTDTVTGDPVPGLASATVYFQLRLISDRRFRINAECDIIDPAAGTVSYELQPEDLDFDGECQAQFLVVFADQTRQTTAVPIPVTVRNR
jgi:methyl-accepting chemotaxis protein